MASILLRISPRSIEKASEAVWLDNESAKVIASDAIDILARASDVNLRFFSGYAPKCIVGGLFYLLGCRHNNPVSQKEIADSLCTTENSVRKLSRRWLAEFPEFFRDLSIRLNWNPMRETADLLAK